MKYCREYAALLSGSVDETLSRTEQLRLRDHLMDCPRCRAYLQDLLAMHNQFPLLEEVDLPAGFTASVMAAVRADMERPCGDEVPPVPAVAQLPPKKHKRPIWKVLAPVAACLVLVVALGSQDFFFPDADAPAPAANSGAPAMVGNAAASAPSTEDVADAANASDAPVETPERFAVSPASSDGAAVTADSPPPDNAAADNRAKTSDEGSSSPLESLPTAQSDHGAPEPFAAQPNETYFATLTLTQAEAGELLAQLLPVSETVESLVYTLNRTEYDLLLTALVEQGVSVPEQVPSEPAALVLQPTTEAPALALVTISLAE